jgi:hypothetical protein
VKKVGALEALKARKSITNSFTKIRLIKSLWITCLLIIIPISKVLSQEYFQQEVNYKINVTLNDRHHELNARETVEYINNSPDTLQFLFFHLWPNGYSNNQTGLAKQLISQNGKERLFNDPELKGYIDSLNFKVEGQSVNWNLMPGTPDICRINLNKALRPGDTIMISTPFHVKIPAGVTSRLGHIGESYQISQWYPKPAVYDKSGWHQMQYLDQGEFYSEFGSFDVSITLPENYTVGATGTLQNDRETERLDKLAADTAWENTIDYRGAEFPASSELMKTLRYTGNEIHDFAWFADKRFHVLKGSVKLPESGREVITWVMFTNQQADLWKDALKYVNRAILYFSNRIGDYPYFTFTAVQSALTAGSGMEYPGLTVIGIEDDAYSLDEVIAHEICHNWFYSALGSDERRYPFMDEGITSAYELRYMNEKYPGKKLWESYFNNRKLPEFFHIDKMPAERIQELEWLVQARLNLEQPINLPAADYSVRNYELILYDKAAIGFNYLRAWLGDSLFDSTMHNYYRTWKSKHPQPDDLRRIFESQTGKDLTWFFGDFINTTRRLDYKVVRFKNQQLLVKNMGEMVSPLIISGIRGDSICFEKWSDGFKGRKWIDLPPGNYSEIKIDPFHLMPELYRLNNNIRVSGIFRKADPVRFQLLYTLEDPDKRTITYIPTVNWTRENGFMAGLTLHNGLWLSKPVEYFLMPFYSFGKPSLAGYGRILFNFTPYNNFIRMATIKLEATQFGAPGNQNYHLMMTGLDLFFRNKKVNNPLLQKVYGTYTRASDLYKINLSEKADMSSYLQFGYILENAGMVNPFNLTAAYESGKSFQKTSVEINYNFSYYGKDQGLNIRMFTGTMLKYSSEVPFYAFSASGRSGRELYLYQGTFPDRFSVFPKTFWSRQMTLSEGGLVSPVNDSLGFSHWLIAVSFSSNLPGKAGRMPVKPFINLLLNDHGLSNGHNSPFFYEVGLKAGIWNFFEIYIPLLVSRNIGSISSSIKERIRIVLTLDSFNKLKLKALHKN